MRWGSGAENAFEQNPIRKPEEPHKRYYSPIRQEREGKEKILPNPSRNILAMVNAMGDAGVEDIWPIPMHAETNRETITR